MCFLCKHSTANNSLLKIIAMVVFISLPFLGFFLGVQYQKSVEEKTPPVVAAPTPTPKPKPNNNGVACTQDVKQCPDGSYVARIPPTCQFAPCPGEKTTLTPGADSKNWKTYTNKQLNYSLKLPKDWDIEGEHSFIGVPGEVTFLPPGEKNKKGFHTIIAITSMTSEDSEHRRYQLDTQTQFNEWKNKNISNGAGERLFKIGESNIDGNDALQIVSRTLPGDPTETFYSIFTWFRKNNANWYIEFGGDERIVKQYQNIYSQILFTFKFLN